MNGISPILPYLHSATDKPSQKTDFLVEKAFANIFSDYDAIFYHDSKYSLSSLRSFSRIGQEIPDPNQIYESYSKIEEELKEKAQTIRALHKSNTELKTLIRELQAEKYQIFRDEIINVNVKLTEELESAIYKYERLTVLVT